MDLKELGLEDITRVVDQYVLATGGLPEEQVAGVFACADVVLDVCLEGFGYSTLQAQAVGVPVVVLEEGPGPELTRFGMQVPVHHVDRNLPMQKPVADAAKIAEALIELYQHRGERSELSPRWVAENFNWDTIAEQWFRVIEDVMVMRETYSLYIPKPSARLRRRAKELVKLP
jgi:glycosyltransferase involved in cell wall biosynthesis